LYSSAFVLTNTSETQRTQRVTRTLVSIYLLCLLRNANAQTTFTIDFEELSRDTVLQEQYASKGVHFSTAQATAHVSITPAFPPPSGEMIGYAVGLVRIDLDQPTVAFGGRVAVDGFGATGTPAVSLSVLDSIGAVGGSGFSINGDGIWVDFSVNARSGFPFRAIEMKGYHTDNIEVGWVFDNLTFTSVPEPSSLVLTALAFALLAWRFR
jgi:hypothetical protein